MYRQVPQQNLPLGAYDPFTEIVEQPKSHDVRFRYLSEGRTAGSIPGESSTEDKKTFPSIRVRNYQGAAVIVVSCVTKNSPHSPHPHSLVGKTAEYECKHGVCTYKVRDTSQVIQFPNLGIHCAKKKELHKAMEERKHIRVDPFRTGYVVNMKELDLAAVRLCWQVFLPDEMGKFTRILEPVVSNIIYDKKSVNDLGICRIDRTSGSVKGGDEVFLLCEKVNKDDIEVRFYEEDETGKLRWEGFGHFGPTDVHHQVAIVFKTPPYTPGMTVIPMVSNREVKVHLRRPSTKECSKSIAFIYEAHYEDPDWIEARRKRKRPLTVPTSAATSAGDIVASVALGTLGTLQEVDLVTKQAKSVACLADLPATVLSIEPATLPATAACVAAQQPIHATLSNLVSHVNEWQPFGSDKIIKTEAATQQQPPTSSSGLPELNSMELSAMGIVTSQELLNVMADPAFFMASQALLEGDPVLANVGCLPASRSQDAVDVAACDGAVSMNITASFSTSIGTELDNLPPPTGTPYAGMDRIMSAGGEFMSICSTSSLDSILNQITAGSSEPTQQQHQQQTVPSAANPSLQQNRR